MRVACSGWVVGIKGRPSVAAETIIKTYVIHHSAMAPTPQPTHLRQGRLRLLERPLGVLQRVAQARQLAPRPHLLVVHVSVGATCVLQELLLRGVWGVGRGG